MWSWSWSSLVDFKLRLPLESSEAGIAKKGLNIRFCHCHHHLQINGNHHHHYQDWWQKFKGPFPIWATLARNSQNFFFAADWSGQWWWCWCWFPPFLQQLRGKLFFLFIHLCSIIMNEVHKVPVLRDDLPCQFWWIWPHFKSFHCRFVVFFGVLVNSNF